MCDSKVRRAKIRLAMIIKWRLEPRRVAVGISTNLLENDPKSMRQPARRKVLPRSPPDAESYLVPLYSLTQLTLALPAFPGQLEYLNTTVRCSVPAFCSSSSFSPLDIFVLCYFIEALGLLADISLSCRQMISSSGSNQSFFSRPRYPKLFFPNFLPNIFYVSLSLSPYFYP